MYQLLFQNFETIEDTLLKMKREQNLVAKSGEKETINLYGVIFCDRDVLKWEHVPHFLSTTG
jgi:hypothetical protein